MVLATKCKLSSLLLLFLIAVTQTAKLGAQALSFAAQPIAGSTSLSIDGPIGPNLVVRQFPASPAPANLATCAGDLSKGTILQFTVGGANQGYVVLAAPTPNTFTLAEPLLRDTLLCIEQRPAAAAGASTFSGYQAVSDPEDNGRVRLNFTGGTMISNQQTSSQTSTAATYLDLGFNFTLRRAGGSVSGPYCHFGKPNGAGLCHDANGAPAGNALIPRKPYHAGQPGIENFINLRMTPVPVATQTTTTTTTTPSGASSGTSTISSSLNALSSQQSFLIFGGFDFPWRLTRWDNNSNAFYAAPLIKAGFDTLLNPSLNSTTSPVSNGTSTVSASTTATFNSVYWYDAAGLRLGWAQYPASTDKAPVPIAQFDMTVGRYSNLPSIICNPLVTTTQATAPTNTACSVSSTTTTGGTSTPSYTVQATSRTLIPRLQLAGFIQIPKYPFVIGVDANLAQYAFGSHVNKVDSLNKPGNDARIYVGVTLDPVSAIKKLGFNP